MTPIIMTMYADIAFPISSYNVFTYSVPGDFRDTIGIGSRVRVPLGKRSTTGIVINFPKRPQFKGTIKAITHLVDQNPVLDPPLWELIQWMSSYYFTPIGKVAQTVLPRKMSSQFSPPKRWLVEIESNKTDFKPALELEKTPAQKRIYDFLLTQKTKIPVRELSSKVANPLQICKVLEKKGLVQMSFLESIPDITGFTFDPIKKNVAFSESQQLVLDKLIPQINKKKFRSNLLHGVTGSGKTEIYIESVRKCLQSNLSVIILLPEISLTPQIAGRFSAEFGEKVALWHSKMTQGIRVWTWKKICSGECKVVIGARSAVFAPVKNLGLIIVDEEQETAFKQESPAPRYHAREVALMRGKLHDAVVVLSSATPSLESYYNRALGKHEPLSLPERFGGAYYPHVYVVDMKEEKEETGKSEQILSSHLFQKINERISSNEQIILLHNRRGYAPVLRCLDCGIIFDCPQCELPLTYHKTGMKLQCHVCKIVKPKIPETCVSCEGAHLKLFGIGTQKTEEYLKNIFPQVSIARLDTDTVKGTRSLTTQLKKFNRKETQILLGTQMIAKGLDFENVTLVGIINADTGLYIPDFRAGERVFQLIYQASGRAGRHKKPGEVIIQTYQPENPVIQCASTLNLKKFYNIALSERKLLHYPPFSWMCKVELSGKSKEKVNAVSMEIAGKLTPSYKGLNMLGPSPSYREKIGSKYRQLILFKSQKEKDPNGKKLHHFLRKNFPEKKLNASKAVSIQLDVNPVSMV